MGNTYYYDSWPLSHNMYLRVLQRPSFWDFWPPGWPRSVYQIWGHTARKNKCLQVCSPTSTQTHTNNNLIKLHILVFLCPSQPFYIHLLMNTNTVIKLQTKHFLVCVFHTSRRHLICLQTKTGIHTSDNWINAKKPLKLSFLDSYKNNSWFSAEVLIFLYF